MNDLGYIPPVQKNSLGATPVTIVSDQDAEQKPQYPRLEFNGEQAEKAGVNKCAIGDEYEITIRIRAKRLGGYSFERGSDDKPSAEFEVISAEKPVMVEREAEESEEEEDETQVERPKARILTPKDMEKGRSAYGD